MPQDYEAQIAEWLEWLSQQKAYSQIQRVAGNPFQSSEQPITGESFLLQFGGTTNEEKFKDLTFDATFAAYQNQATVTRQETASTPRVMGVVWGLIHNTELDPTDPVDYEQYSIAGVSENFGDPDTFSTEHIAEFKVPQDCEVRQVGSMLGRIDRSSGLVANNIPTYTINVGNDSNKFSEDYSVWHSDLSATTAGEEIPQDVYIKDLATPLSFSAGDIFKVWLTYTDPTTPNPAGPKDIRYHSVLFIPFVMSDD